MTIEVRQNPGGSVNNLKASIASVHLESLGLGNWMLVVETYDDYIHRAYIKITPEQAFIYESLNCSVICTGETK